MSAGQVVNFARSAAGRLARIAQLQVGHDIFDVVKHLIPLVQRLHVDAANPREAFVAQPRDQMSADEPPTPRY